VKCDQEVIENNTGKYHIIEPQRHADGVYYADLPANSTPKPKYSGQPGFAYRLCRGEHLALRPSSTLLPASPQTTGATQSKHHRLLRTGV